MPSAAGTRRAGGSGCCGSPAPGERPPGRRPRPLIGRAAVHRGARARAPDRGRARRAAAGRPGAGPLEQGICRASLRGGRGSGRREGAQAGRSGGRRSAQGPAAGVSPALRDRCSGPGLLTQSSACQVPAPSRVLTLLSCQQAEAEQGTCTQAALSSLLGLQHSAVQCGLYLTKPQDGPEHAGRRSDSPARAPWHTASGPWRLMHVCTRVSQLPMLCSSPPVLANSHIF
jgi:hypothetical protein